MIDILSQVDEYCERSTFDFFAEPLNFLSNGFFWLAAWLAWRELKRSPVAHSRSLRSLLILLFLVGLGSASYHSLATLWAKACDVGFIGLFVIGFMWFWARDIRQWSSRRILAFFASFVALSAFFQLALRNLPLNGSQGYFGVAIFLLLLGRQQTQLLSGSRTLTGAGCIFLLALVFRTLDASICPVWPYGTHFLWHSLNALLCFLVVRGMREELEFKTESHS